MVAVLALTMFLIDWGVGPSAEKPNLSSCIKDGFQTHIEGTDKSVAAVLAISMAVFPYVGVETFTITAFEARSPEALKLPSKRMVPFVMFLYTLSVLGFSLNVPWNNGYLPAYYSAWTPSKEAQKFTCHNRDPQGLNRRQAVADLSNTDGHVLPTIAIDLANINGLSGSVNACLLYSALSTANSSLFMASRILHSFTATHGETKFLSYFNRLNDQGSPVWAVCASLFFCFVPFLSFLSSDSAKHTQQILISIGSTSCVLVWAAQCLAYIRYRNWLGMHSKEIGSPEWHGYRKYYPYEQRKWTDFPSQMQPALAWVSGILCVIIVLGFPIAGLSHGKGDRKLIAINTYLGPGLCLCLFLGLKAYKWRRAEKGWVRLGSWEELRRVIERLRDDSLSNAREDGNLDEDGSISLRSQESHQHLS
ncbi:hypothetical protein D6D26_10003 [Aureobasidium pullulans]|nr:hypothetical protein D6D26_10003 [Aureobasidium pullulans]